MHQTAHTNQNRSESFMTKSFRATCLGLLFCACSGYAEQASVPGPFIDAGDVTWKVNDFPIVRWKTLIGGNEGGQIEQDDVQFGIWELAPHAIYHGHRHDAPEIYYVISGTGVWTVGASSREVGPGSTIYTAPGAVHKMVNSGDEPLRAVWLWWAPDGRREVFSGAYEYTEPPPQQATNVAPWGANEPDVEQWR
jgi:quercetin dioxygenase-like cupin family protein